MILTRPWFALAVAFLLIPRLVMALPAGWSDDRRLSQSAGLSLVPSVVADNGNAVFVAWSDDRSGRLPGPVLNRLAYGAHSAVFRFVHSRPKAAAGLESGSCRADPAP